VPLAVLDDKARRILGAMFRGGLFDHPVGDGAFPEAAHAAAALRIAEQGIVLLRNDRGVLPLSPRRGLRSIAVIGADAETVAAQGGGAARVEPTHGVSVLDGLRARAGPEVSVRHAPGADPVSAAHLLPGLPAIPSSVLAPPGDPGERGLLAEYWFGAGFDGAPWVVRVDPQVAVSLGFFNYPSVSASSRPQLPNLFSLRPLAARWTGTLTAPATGEYVLALTSRGRASVRLDGSVVLERLDAAGLATTSATVRLVEGEPRELRVEYVADDPAIGLAKDLGGDVALGWAPPPGALAPAVREAAALAAASDVAVVFVRTYESEGRDRPDLALPNGQDELVRAVAAANRRTVVVLATGQPVTMPWLDEVGAVVQAWYAGQEQGRAVARVLFGDVNPSGKLPVTFPRRLEDTPTAAPERFPGSGGGDPAVEYAEGLLVGHRWYDARGLEPLFPFGHGLSYTTFRYGDLEVAPPAPLPAWRALSAVTAGSGPARVAFTVENTGARAGAEVAQVYVGTCPGDAAAPPRRLAGFAKVPLAPGVRRRVVVDLDPRALGSWSVERGAWVGPGCALRVWVGSSSRDLRLEGTLPRGGDP
jgi:beta-glucosidase